MPLNVLDGSLDFTAQLSVEGFINGARIMEEQLDSVAKKAASSSQLQQEALKQVSQAQANNAQAVTKSADAAFDAWKTRTEQILRMAKEAGVKAGESFEFKEAPINGVESSTVFSDVQLKQMQDALTLLDSTLSTQEQIAKTGLEEIEFLQLKRDLLAEMGKDMDAQSQDRLTQLEVERDAIQIISDERKKAEGEEVKKKKQSVSDIIGDDFAETLQNAKRSFSELDEQTQQFITDIVQLEIRLSEAQATQKALDEARDAGKISLQQYGEASADVAAEQKRLLQEVELVTNQQKEFEAINQAGTGSLQQKKALLAQLTTAYEQLSDAQREGDAGKDLVGRITAIKAEIKGLSPDEINKAKTATVSAFSELRKLKDEMARNPNSPFFNEWKARAKELQESIEGARNELKLATSESAGIDALTSGIRGLVGGFTALTGAVGLFTDNTEEAERISRDAMSALALLNGIQELSNVFAKEGALNVYLLSQMRKGNAVAAAADTAATAANTAATKAQTVASTEAAAAQKGLKAALLANPAAAILVGITALIGAYVIFRKRTEELTASQKIRSEIEKEAVKSYAKEIVQLTTLGKIITDTNATRKQRNQAVEDYNKIADEANQIDKTAINNTSLVEAAIARQTELIKKRALARAAENVIAAKAEIVFTKQIELETKFPELQNQIKKLYSTAQTAIDEEGKKLKLSGIKAEEVFAFVDLPDDQLKKIADKNPRLKVLLDDRTKTIVQGIQGQLNTLKGKFGGHSAFAALSEEIESANDDLRDALSVGQEYITSGQEQAKVVKQSFKAENELNAILDKRKKTLEDIAALERDAKQSGLTQEASAIDKINEKYDKQLEAIKKTNIEIQRFNERHKKTPQALLGQPEIDRTNVARSIEVQNTILRQDAAKYIEVIRNKKGAFDAFMKAQLDGNELLAEKTRQQYADQLQGFTSYLTFLQQEALKLWPQIMAGTDDVGVIEKFKALNKAISEEREVEQSRQREKAVENFRLLLNATNTYNQEKAKINKKYDDLEAIVRKDDLIKNKDEALAILEEQRGEEITSLDNNLIRQSALYKKLNQDIIGFTRKRLKEEATLLKDKLKTDTTLTPQQKADIQGTIDQYENIIDEKNKVANDFNKMSDRLSDVAGIFGNMGSALEGVNDELSESLTLMGELVGVASNVASAIAQFATGQIIAGIGSVVSALTGIFSMGKKAREERRRKEAELQQFVTNQYIGEQAINALYRERALEQVKLNKLRLEGLKAEADLLRQQQASIRQNFDTVLAELQKQTFKVVKSIDLGGILGNITTTTTESLFGKSFDEIEQLFLKGQLEGKAKDLFELLQRLKEEGLDVDAILLQNAETMKEILTGTTSDSITDSIVDGFRNGRDEAADFADTFQTLMQNALLQSLKMKYLEGPLKEFFNEFAALSESDGGLSSGEVVDLQNMFNGIIENANEQFEQLQQIAGINIGGSGGQGNSLTGAIKGMTEQQAELLAGQFGGLRLTALEQLNKASQSLLVQQEIQVNTGLTASRVLILLEKFNAYETGSKKLKVEL